MHKKTPTPSKTQTEDRYPMHRGRGRDKRHTAKQQRQLGRRVLTTALLQIQKGWLS